MQTTLHNINPKGSNHLKHSKNKRHAGQTDQDDLTLLTDSIKMMDSLFQMRFVEKISRPIQKRAKDQYVQKFAGKMEGLHHKLDRIRVELGDKSQSQNGNIKGKSVLGSATHKPADWKKSIRAIENRYIEVFVEGSFKHYQKIYESQSLAYPLRTINIQEWASNCLRQHAKQTGCC